jgi:hypothetical protein
LHHIGVGVWDSSLSKLRSDRLTEGAVVIPSQQDQDLGGGNALVVNQMAHKGRDPIRL